MKPILYSILFLLTATHSAAQAPVSDTLEILSVRGHTCCFYIDGIIVRGCRTEPAKSDSEPVSDPVEVITGGLPINFGDVDSSVIWINKTPEKVIPRKIIVSDKEHKMATE